VPVKNTRQNYAHIGVSIRYITTPDADARLSRAIDLLLENAARNQKPTAASSHKYQKEKPSDKISNRDGSGVRK
jgi:hypothetical protein